MKKVFMSMAAAAMLTLVACGGGSKSADSAKETGKEATEKTETKKESASSPKLDQYIKLIEKATPLLEKVSKGDAAAVQEYTKIAEDMAKIATELQNELANNPELLQKYTDAANKFAAEAAKIYGQ